MHMATQQVTLPSQGADLVQSLSQLSRHVGSHAAAEGPADAKLCSGVEGAPPTQLCQVMACDAPPGKQRRVEGPVEALHGQPRV